VAPADPAGYPVECSGDACYQRGQRVRLIANGRFTQAAIYACNGAGGGFIWESAADPAPGAPPTAQTYTCGRPH